MSRQTPAVRVVAVECYAGSRGEETPRRFWTEQRQIEIAEVVERWLEPDHRYFKVRDRTGDLHVLRHDVTFDRWELTSGRATANASTPQRPDER